MRHQKPEGDLHIALRTARRKGDREGQLAALRAMPDRPTLLLSDMPEDDVPVWWGVDLCWDARTQRLFACNCAERVLGLYETRNPCVTTPRQTIAMSRAFAEGAIDHDTWIRGRDVCRFVALAATSKEVSRESAWSAAADNPWSAAAAARRALRAVAYSVPGYSYGSVRKAEDDERTWQDARLVEYLLGCAFKA